MKPQISLGASKFEPCNVKKGETAEFGKLLGEETDKWAKVVKFSGATSE